MSLRTEPRLAGFSVTRSHHHPDGVGNVIILLSHGRNRHRESKIISQGCTETKGRAVTPTRVPRTKMECSLVSWIGFHMSGFSNSPSGETAIHCHNLFSHCFSCEHSKVLSLQTLTKGEGERTLTISFCTHTWTRARIPGAFYLSRDPHVDL